MSKITGLILRILCLSATPWIVFISTTNILFLGNQADVDYDIQVYFPFVVMFIISLLLGMALQFLSKRRTGFRSLLWFYYLSGVFFLVFSYSREFPVITENEVAFIAFLSLLLGATVLLLRKHDPVIITNVVAIFATLLIISDIYAFVAKYEYDLGDKVEKPRRADKVGIQDAANKGNLPNIYHIVLDGYQSDMVSLTFTEETKKDLRGFVYFSKNVTVSGRTRLSIPCLFAGRMYDPNEPFHEYIKEAFNSEDSLLYWLKKSGYSTTAYLHKRWSFEPNLFDTIYFHHNAFEEHDVGHDAFYAAWLYRCLPAFASRLVLGEKILRDMSDKDVSPKAYAVASYQTFVNFMKRERTLGASQRYCFLHLILPHPPYVMNGDCEYEEETESIAQFCCANKVRGDLVRRVRELGRYDNSLIIIQGDHGLNIEIQDNHLRESSSTDKTSIEWNRLRSKALLLVKPVGAGADSELNISCAETTLLDITPTIFEAVGLKPPPFCEGVPLFPGVSSTTSRKRYYHLYRRDFTEKIYRFVVEGDEFRFDKILRPDDFDDRMPAFYADITNERAKVLSNEPGTSGKYVVKGNIFFRFKIEEDGVFQLKARVIAKDGSSNSYFARMGNEDYRKWNIKHCKKWAWRTVPFTWELEKGEHLLFLRHREPTPVDQIELTRLQY
ncbi:MAG: sulfatase-like hydrolase/transferase [Deltaproteobacteria bacterium]|nr:sulfatase-like hydrolase/transferase [Deltaproteobacteria bacterium]